MDQNSLNALLTLFTLVTEVQSDPPKAALKLFRLVGENKREGATFPDVFVFFKVWTDEGEKMVTNVRYNSTG
jgi:hypothetical protein